MVEVIIIARDINGKRTEHLLRWDEAFDYVEKTISDEDEILLVFVADVCVYSQLGHNPITKMELLGFFA